MPNIFGPSNINPIGGLPGTGLPDPSKVTGENPLTKILSVDDKNIAHVAANASHKVNTGTLYGFRHFTFILSNETGIGNVTKKTVELNINPEDLQQDTPYRVNTTQTLGGAFVDVWGQGVRKIVLRGHTGWKRQSTTTQTHDGFDNIMAMKDDIFFQYFNIREEASGKKSHSFIESNLKIILIDRLHEKAYRVIPEMFRLLRNKTRPLLHMYEASFIIVDNDDEQKNQKSTALSDADKTKALWRGFEDTKKKFDDLSEKVKGIKGPFKDALSSVTKLGSNLSGMFSTLMTTKNEIAKGVAGVRDVAHQTTQAIHRAMGTIQSYVDFSGIAADAKYIFNDIKSVMGDLDCLIKDIKSFGLYTYRGISGASACAGLVGIPPSPLSLTRNSFETLKTGAATTQFQSISNSISVSAQASAQKVLTIDTPLNLTGKGFINI